MPLKVCNKYAINMPKEICTNMPKYAMENMYQICKYLQKYATQNMQ